MAVDFNILARVPTIGSQIMAGQEAGREAAARNMLLQQRQLEFQQAQEDRQALALERQRKAAREAQEEAMLGKVAEMFGQSGMPLTLDTAQQGLAFALRSRNPQAIQAMQSTVEALRRRQAREELLGGATPPAGAPPAAAAAAPAPMPAPVAAAAPQEVSALAVEQAAYPRPEFYGQGTFAGTAPTAVTSPVGEFPTAPAPANQLAPPRAPVANAMAAAPAVQVAGPTAMPTPAAPSAAVQEQIASLRAQQRRALAAGEKDIAAYFGSQITSLEAQTDPRKRYVVVGNQIFDVATPQFITPPALPARAGAPAPEARTKPAGLPRAPSGYRYTDGGNLEPIPGGPAARREAAAAQKEGAKPAEKPATVTEQQASTATQRLLNRATEIADIVQRNRKAEAPTLTEAAMENIPYLSRATNLVRDTDRQIVSSAQDDILDALLYLSTGAAYNKEQLQQQKSAYLPSWSDDPPTRQVKRQRLAQAIEGARVRAGRAWTPELDAAMQRLMEVPVMGGRAPGAAPAATGAAPAPAGAGRYQTLSNDELLRQLGVKPKGQ